MQENHSLLNDSTFWFTVSFIIFVVAAWVLGRKPIAAVFDGYATKIRTELEEASRLRMEAQRILDETQTKQANALKEADAIRASAKEQVQLMTAQAEKDLATNMKLREQQMLDRIRILEEQAAGEIRARTVDMALKAAEQILRERMSAASDAAVISRQIASMSGGLKKVA